MYSTINQLIQFGIRHDLIEIEDTSYVRNQLCSMLNIQYEDIETEVYTEKYVQPLLTKMSEFAVGQNIIKESETEEFERKIMNVLTPRPSYVIHRFNDLYKMSPSLATDDFYRFSMATNYIPKDRILKSRYFVYECEYGKFPITLNVQKDRNNTPYIVSRNYEGKKGNETLRFVPVKAKHHTYDFQFSSKGYCKEECFFVSDDPIVINEEYIEDLLKLIDQFPHYFIGNEMNQNYFVGGRDTFALQSSKKLVEYEYQGVKYAPLYYPMSVLKLESKSKKSLTEFILKINDQWKAYDNFDLDIMNDQGDMNYINVIATKENGTYICYVVLRCDAVSLKYPEGVFQPHARHHHLKQDSICLLDALGIGVFSGETMKEMDELKQDILDEEPIDHSNPHFEWIRNLHQKYVFRDDEIEDIMNKGMGETFIACLEDGCVFRHIEYYQDAFEEFILSLNK